MSIGVWIVENNQILAKKKTIFPLLSTLLALVRPLDEIELPLTK